LDFAFVRRKIVSTDSRLDPAWENEFHNQWMGHYLSQLTDAAAQTVAEYVSKVTSPFIDVKIATLGGARWNASVRILQRSAIATPNIRLSFNRVGRIRATPLCTWEAMKAHCDGTVYANFIADEGEMRVAGAYNVAAFQRLRKIKSRYDPKNLFRMNQNIRPA
jgi:Berberine and berberine like